MQTICFGEGQVAELKPKKPESRSLTALCIPVGACGGHHVWPTEGDLGPCLAPCGVTAVPGT